MPFGRDWDDLLGYYTVKYVKIKDKKLGLLQKFLMGAIAAKVFALTIFYKCDHLLDVPIVGSARGQARQPTVADCNPNHRDCMSDFTPIEKLPYCKQFNAKDHDARPQEPNRWEPTPDGCPWSTSTSSSELVGCKDGSTCNVKKSKLGWNCCGIGDRAKCPRGHKACNNLGANGVDFSCFENCTLAGGDKPCVTPEELSEATHDSKACPWLASTSSADEVGCKDGSTCNVKKLGWNCCGIGSRRKCPKGHVACNALGANGADFSCFLSCTMHGGEKLCMAGGSHSQGMASTKPQQASCVYWDAATMTRGRSPVPGTLFLPTRVTETRQKKGCNPDASNAYTCKTRPWVHIDGEHTSTSMIADVERFTVLVNQAFSSNDDSIKFGGQSIDHHGFYKGRPDLQDWFTKRKGFVERLEKDDAAELVVISKLHEIPNKPDFTTGVFQNVFHTVDGHGDVFEVNDILRLADLRGADLLDEPKANGKTMRYDGACINVEITYSNKANFDIFGKTEPTYTITARYVPLNEYKVVYEQLYEKALPSDRRDVQNVHGLLILFTVKGYVSVFDITHLLTILTTALLSVTLANTLTDVLMIYLPCFGLKEHYKALKNQESMDFSNVADRVRAIKERCKAQNETYDPNQHKSSACADAINKFASSCQENIDDIGAHIDHDTMLKIICTFDQRLNRLDGMDVSEDDDCGRLIAAWNKDFKEQDGVVRAMAITASS